MPRISRKIALEGGRFFHVTARGVNGRSIFQDDHDRRAFLQLLRLVVLRHRWRVHAYCLMENHVHLVIETHPARLSTGMHRLLFRHAQRFNERHGRKGHLFGDRYAARVIRSPGYLLNACRYVRWNPVRSGLVSTPSRWPWTGPRADRRRRTGGRDPPLGAATLALCASKPHRTLRGAGRERPASRGGPALLT